MSLNYRQKILVGLLKAFGGKLSAVDFQKYLFLYSQEFTTEPSFEFVPYKFGGFSFQSYADRRRLIEVGVLAEGEEWRVKDKSLLNDIDVDMTSFDKLYSRYSKLKGDALVKDIYERYPYYAINSEIASKLMDKKQLAAIRAAQPKINKQCFFTIGYEGSSFEGYLNRLIRNDIRTLIDVRRNPLSRKYGFSKSTLSDKLTRLGIEYIHMPELGIASDRRQELNTQSDYNRLFASYEKRELKSNKVGLENLFNIFLKRKRVAITCFEAEVCMCHRGSIVKALSALPGWEYEVKHI